VYHQPVLLQECIDGLAIKADGVYVDVTFGGGGHSREILKHLGENGRLIAFDQDKDAQQNAIEDERFLLVQANFRELKRFLRLHGVKKVDGILADLGVSSYQFDTAERGFSFRFEGPLDMRMNQGGEQTAAGLLQSYNAEELQRVFSEYGEVRNAKTLAVAIVEYRKQSSLNTTTDFLQFLEKMAIGEKHKYYAQVFQAIRIEINDELGALKDLMQQCTDVLGEEGRLAVITFHSLEDRLVKNYMRHGSFSDEPEKDFFGRVERKYKLITKKPIVASDTEQRENSRSRSAKLRVAEKLESTK
jgi:16S rRNA (cytosine1402-N4)-methyltransferase